MVHTDPAGFPAGTTHIGLNIAGVNAAARIQVDPNTHAYGFSIAAANVQTLSRITRDTLTVTLSYHSALSGGRELGEDNELIFSRATAPARPEWSVVPFTARTTITGDNWFNTVYRFHGATSVGLILPNIVAETVGGQLGVFNDSDVQLQVAALTADNIGSDRVITLEPHEAVVLLALRDDDWEVIADAFAARAALQQIAALTPRVPTAAQLALFLRRNPTSVLGLIDAASIAWDTDNGLLAAVTLAGNRTLANPTNVQTGDVLVLEAIQDGTGSRTLAYGTNFRWPDDTAPELSTAANTRDVLTFLALSPTVLIGGPIIKAHA